MPVIVMARIIKLGARNGIVATNIRLNSISPTDIYMTIRPRVFSSSF
jgi:hypothetical protein